MFPKPQSKKKESCQYCLRAAGEDGLCFKCRAIQKAIKNKRNSRALAKKGVKSSKSSKPKRPTGELKLFLEIWDERPHVSEVSGKPLLPKEHPQWIWQFSHILPKGLYPKIRLLKKNIKLALPEEHDQWGNHIHKCTGPEWEPIHKRAEELREAYNRGEYDTE